ncbi:MAG TPA: hypothetical protein VGC79_35485 [Polyangiaceae bacterium]
MTDLSLGGKALVQAARNADRPSDADRERVLALLQARLGDAAVLTAGVAHTPSTTAGTSALRSKLLKWGWVGPTVLVAGAWWFVPRGGHEGAKAVPAPSASVSLSVPAVAADPVSAAGELAPSVASSSTPIATPDAQSRPVEVQKVVPRSGDGLAEEVALLSRAETELHAGRPAKALLALAEHQRKFPRGTLAEERTAARIQALCALGRNEEANAQLRQLAHISPNSAHEERARQACRDPRATSP